MHMLSPVNDLDMTSLEVEIGPTFPLAEEISRSLAGAVFPLSRQQVIWVARENDAPKTLLSLLHLLPDQMVRSLDEVEQLLAR
jgi:hypothetical protein